MTCPSWGDVRVRAMGTGGTPTFEVTASDNCQFTSTFTLRRDRSSRSVGRRRAGRPVTRRSMSRRATSMARGWLLSP